MCGHTTWKIRSLHGRHIVELTTPMGQYVRYMTLQAIDTALGRSYAILKSQLTTHLKAWKSALRGRTVEDQIATRAPHRRADDSDGPIRPLHDSPGRRHRAGPLICDSQVAAHHSPQAGWPGKSASAGVGL